MTNPALLVLDCLDLGLVLNASRLETSLLAVTFVDFFFSGLVTSISFCSFALGVSRSSWQEVRILLMVLEMLGTVDFGIVGDKMGWDCKEDLVLIVGIGEEEATGIGGTPRGEETDASWAT